MVGADAGHSSRRSIGEDMANHKSAEKRARQIERRTAVNRARTSRIKTYVKKVEAAIESGNKSEAAEALRAVIKEIILTPGPKPGQIHAELRSEFEILLQWAQDDGGQRRKAVGGFLGGPLSVTADSRAGMTEGRGMGAACPLSPSRSPSRPHGSDPGPASPCRSPPGRTDWAGWRRVRRSRSHGPAAHRCAASGTRATR